MSYQADLREDWICCLLHNFIVNALITHWSGKNGIADEGAVDCTFSASVRANSISDFILVQLTDTLESEWVRVIFHGPDVQ